MPKSTVPQTAHSGQATTERIEAMSQLRATLKARKITHKNIGWMAGVSPGWVGVVIRGGYPYHQAYRLPKNIRVSIQGFGVDVPEVLWTF